MGYEYWTNALAGKIGPVHDSDPQPGFYRKRTRRGGPYVPVAIWEQDGKFVALVDGREADAAEIWTYCCQYPIREDWYRARMDGQPWPDEDGAVAESLAPPPADHNNPPTDPADILGEQIDAALKGVADYEQINSDETAARAQSLRARLNELCREADKTREAEKRPHLEAGKAIDAKFQPLVKMAKAGADLIAKALSAHETRKERARREAEQARLKAEAEARPKAVAQAPSPPIPAPQLVTTTIRGAYGRAASVKVVKVATVKDQDAAYGFLKTHKELSELIAALAQRAVNAGYEVPGVEVTEERRVT